MPSANLILVTHPSAADPADFHRIAQHIVQIDPKIRCVILPDKPCLPSPYAKISTSAAPPRS